MSLHRYIERDLAHASVLDDTGARAIEMCGVRIRDLILDVEDPYLRSPARAARCEIVRSRSRRR
jgi:hypothetical protein